MACLKRLCITFSVIYGILGVFFLFSGIIVSSYKTEELQFDSETNFGITICCVFGSFMILLALLGSFGAYKEKKWALGVYNVFLVLQAVGCFKVLPSLSSVQTEVNTGVLNDFTPLNQAKGHIQKAVNKMQTVAECCGIWGYEDWGDSIPQSCHCPPDYENKASKCHHVKPPSKDTWSWQRGYGKPEGPKVEVYKQPCGPIILNYMEMGIKYGVGLFITITLVVTISAMLHLLMCCHIKEPTPSSPVASGEDPKPPAYTVLYKGQGS
ncbi:hypothetical protein AGOR_G00180060 [Albula goreensis]|uniref:Tetraspanin n=1 Tax=Albula goreensis TaxID=1534307 RepID=A0A8T3CXA6_9TELE|nr:hypothetical protein AGOR_G00180060 [Albula goreensis]